MPTEAIMGLLVPFLGTTLGAACVFVMRGSLSALLERSLAGFAAGVMVAASIWSLLQPALDGSEMLGRMAWMPAFVGFWAGTLFILALDRAIPHLHLGEDEAEGPRTDLARTTLMVLAVTLHNIPEGMAVGVVFAGWLAGESAVTLAGAATLALGIAIQNFPEGAIISLPLRAEGSSRMQEFAKGTASGVVEPLAALLTIAFARQLVPWMPYLLSFAAGAMMYVVVEELVPQMAEGEHSHLPVLMFAFGFTVMMALDVALG